jgi:hypothetical protein
VIRAGRYGEDEEAALEEGRAIVRFNEFGDLNAMSHSCGLSERRLGRATRWVHDVACVRTADLDA